MLNTVAVGTDGTPTASIAVGAAIELAESNNARLVLISSYHNGSNEQTTSEEAPLDIQWTMTPAGEADTILNEAENRARAHGLNVTKVARAGNPADVLCDIVAEKHADVLVIGNKGIHRRVLGSVPNSVAHKAPCSVLIVKTT